MSLALLDFFCGNTSPSLIFLNLNDEINVNVAVILEIGTLTNARIGYGESLLQTYHSHQGRMHQKCY